MRLDNAGFLHDPALRSVAAAVAVGGDEVRVVGGAVRNTLLGLPVADVDLATTAPPETTTARLTAAGIKAVPTGFEHGTVTAVTAGRAFEVTTLRADVATDGRRARVAFGTDWREDAGRRDFTMNAIYVDLGGTILDPVGGVPDCLARRVRFIGDADSRIREDYLRILRFFRFHAVYGEGPPDAAGLEAATRLQAGLDLLSRERVGQELRKLVTGARAAETAALMQETGILLRVLAGVARPERLARLAALAGETQADASPALRLTALAAFVEDDAERLAERLRLSNAERAVIAAVQPLARRLGAGWTASGLRALVQAHGKTRVLDALLLAAADGAMGDVAEALRLVKAWEAPAFPIGGDDLVAAGLSPGPALGRKLAELEARWVASDFSLTRDELLAIAR